MKIVKLKTIKASGKCGCNPPSCPPEMDDCSPTYCLPEAYGEDCNPDMDSDGGCDPVYDDCKDPD